MKTLRYAEVDHIRNTPNKSLLLFLTDRCPVGCGHCSVNSRISSPTITNQKLFKEILDGICSIPNIELIGISGGEPFIEKWGLIEATEKLNGARKDIALYTSGVWATTAKPKDWIEKVITKCSCIFLSTDAFHQTQITDLTFTNALSIIQQLGVWIIVQVLNQQKRIDQVKILLTNAFGQKWQEYAEIHIIPALSYGRGIDVFGSPLKKLSYSDFGHCPALASPVIRYDGKISACCNEAIIMGFGPDRLRTTFTKSTDLNNTLNKLSKDELNNLLSSVTISDIISLPHFQNLKSIMNNKKYATICDVCWDIQEYVIENPIEEKWKLMINIIFNSLAKVKNGQNEEY